MNGASSGFLSGAASGASLGSSFGPYGAAIGGVVGGIAGWFGGSYADESFENSADWAMYNATQEYSIDMTNLMSQTMLAQFNSYLVQQQAEIESQYSLDVAAWNIDIIEKTVAYNDELLEEELALMWEAADLDLTLLAQERAVERGEILADQAASGTVMNTGSNLDTIINQKTQEELEASIIMHNADIAAADINNARAQSQWEGDIAIQQAEWEGKMGSYIALSNAELTSAGIMAEAGMNVLTGMMSADYSLESSLYGISQAEDAYSSSNTQDLISGLFSAASTAAKTYYMDKDYSSLSYTDSTESSSESSSGSGSYDWGTGYETKYSDLMSN